MAMSNHETAHVASVFTALHVGSIYEDSLDPEMKNLSMDFWLYQPEQKASNVVDHANWRSDWPRMASLVPY